MKTTYPPRRPVRRKRRPPPWISLRRDPHQTSGTSLRVSALQTDDGRLRYIEPFACAHPLRVHDGAETASAISLKQASTIAEMRIFIRLEDALHYLKQQRLSTTFDSPALTGRSTPKLILKGNLGALEAASHQVVQENNVAFGEGADILRPGNRTAQPRPKVAPALFEPSGQLPTSTTSAALRSRSPKNKAFEFEQPQEDKPATPALPPLTILRRKQVEERTGLSRSAIYDRMDPNSPRHDPSFPKQIKLSASASGWVESEIETWLKGRMAARSKPP
ncbi:helix-turn-helix transcriptional regulator [Variovorax paradoxus]|uniref:helix-turn-helix transcriptional regulator n=1 Tax=Variovorax paradoxus TaxID=34073 RepID=UPI003ECF9A8C